MLDSSGIRSLDVFYRLSTRVQELPDDSLLHQRREVEEHWAAPNGIKVRRRIILFESGKVALPLTGDAFVFSKCADYIELIVEYQKMHASELPDAIAIDWSDRWSRNVLEYTGLITAFRTLGIPLLAIGDGLELTDPRNQLITHIRAAVSLEQSRLDARNPAKRRTPLRSKIK